MKKNYTSKNLIAAIVLVFTMGLSAQNEEFTDGSLTYSQDFDGLNNVLNQNGLDWTNGTTPLVGWYAFINMDTTPVAATQYSTGCDNEGAGTFDFPGANVPNSLGYSADANVVATDRALGYRVNVASGDSAFMLNLKNNSSMAITQLEVTYTGEQWAQIATDPQSLYFFYKIDATDPSEGGFTEVPALKFTSLQVGEAPGTSTVRIDGNDAANKTTGITATFAVALPVSSTITLRWYKGLPDTGSDHILAIDDLTVTATQGTLAVSELHKIDLNFYVSSENLNISAKSELSEISIYAITGVLVKKETINSMSANVSINQLQKGIYIARVVAENGETMVKKFVK